MHESADWKQSHVCTINFCGSAGAMEPIGTLDKRQEKEGSKYMPGALDCGEPGPSTIASRLGLELSPFCKHHLKRKDAQRIQGSKYKSIRRAKKLRRASRRKRKGLDDKQ